MREELAGLNHCAVPFLSRAVVNLCWYYSSLFHQTVVDIIRLDSRKEQWYQRTGWIFISYVLDIVRSRTKENCCAA